MYLQLPIDATNTATYILSVEYSFGGAIYRRSNELYIEKYILVERIPYYILLW